MDAVYRDGRTSRSTPVRLEFRGGRLYLYGPDGQQDLDLAQVRISARIGNTPRFIYLPDGGCCETRDNDAVDAVLAARGGDRFNAWLHRLESRLGYALLALLVTAGVGWGAVVYGIPWLAQRVAYALPPGVESSLGEQALAFLDGRVFTSSQLDPEGQRRLQAQFAAMQAGLPGTGHARLLFRRSSLAGANALALPGGTVVVTDDLVELAAGDAEVLAVLAHELGHVAHRDSLRRLLQDSLLSLIVIAVTGDVTDVSSLVVALPPVLLQAGYSRDMERAADRYALGWMQSAGVDPVHYGAILIRLEESQAGSASRAMGFLSTHPPTAERLRLIEKARQGSR